MHKKLKEVWGEFTKAFVPFKGYIKDYFSDEKLEEMDKKLNLGAKIDDKFKDAVEDMIYECKRLKKAAKKLRRYLY